MSDEWQAPQAASTGRVAWRRAGFLVPGFGTNVTQLIYTGRRRREPANIQNTFNQINKHKWKAAAPHGRLPHTKHKLKPRPGPLSSSTVVTPPFIPSGAPPWDSRPAPPALGPAPLVTNAFAASKEIGSSARSWARARGLLQSYLSLNTPSGWVVSCGEHLPVGGDQWAFGNQDNWQFVAGHCLLNRTVISSNRAESLVWIAYLIGPLALSLLWAFLRKVLDILLSLPDCIVPAGVSALKMPSGYHTHTHIWRRRSLLHCWCSKSRL